jgi:riboflavin kinase/FMN adenylyltransferase
MRIHLGILPGQSQPRALTIGNFDGVHLGHRAMLDELKAAARKLGLPSAVLTFEPHPREFFAPENAPARLTTLREKLELLEAYGVDEVFVLRFNQSLAATTADDFIRHLLVEQLQIRWLLVGDDFRFGAGRSGQFSSLEQAGRTLGFECHSLESFIHQGERVSSSGIRTALAAGQMEHAAQLLGRPWFITGRVCHGAQLGRGLGYPTANIALGRRTPAATGIFVVSVQNLGAQPRPAVASLGVRPTVELNAAPLLEVHLFDFHQNLYGQRLHVNLLHKLRDEETFPDLESLKAQIERDAQAARHYFETLAP